MQYRTDTIDDVLLTACLIFLIFSKVINKIGTVFGFSTDASQGLKVSGGGRCGGVRGEKMGVG